jgi:hypothetical protein
MAMKRPDELGRLTRDIARSIATLNRDLFNQDPKHRRQHLPVDSHQVLEAFKRQIASYRGSAVSDEHLKIATLALIQHCECTLDDTNHQGLSDKGRRELIHILTRSREAVNYIDGSSTAPEDIAPENLPEQRASPIYTDIISGQIALAEGPEPNTTLSQEQLRAAANYLTQEVEELAKDLSDSNFDKRFVRSLRKLKRLLDFKTSADSIALGLHVEMLSGVLESSKEEMAEITSRRIGGALKNLSQIALQYVDWREFVANARDLKLPAIEAEFETASEKVISTLENAPDQVDTELIGAFRELREIAGSTGFNSKTILGWVRSFSNTVSTMIRFCYGITLEVIAEAGTKARPQVTRALAIGMIATTISLIYEFLSIIRVTPELSWIFGNIEKLEKMLEIVKKAGL